VQWRIDLVGLLGARSLILHRKREILRMMVMGWVLRRCEIVCERYKIVRISDLDVD